MKSKLKRKNATTVNAKKKSKWSNSNNSFLSQLQTLRDFTKGCGSDIQYSESDLSNCLRQCGYNVQMAAEHLITGQYKINADETAKNSRTIDIKRLSEIKTAPAVSHNANNHQTKRTITPDTGKKSMASSLKTNEAAAEGITNFQSKYKSANNYIKTLSVTNNTSKCTPKRNNDSRSDATRMLLCHRWICGISTTRRGCIRYNEAIAIHASSTRIHTTASANSSASTKIPKGADIVRFKGDRIEGTLENQLSSFLAPLLRGMDRNNQQQLPLIQIQCKGLMEDPRLDIGMEVPLELNVYITRPHDFFALFQDDSGGTSSGASEFWNVKKTETSIFAKAAFDLLQWAHYSSLPKFDSNQTGAGAENGTAGVAKSAVGAESNDASSEEPDADSHAIAEEGNTPEWAQNLYSNSAKNVTTSNLIPEESDPLMLQKKGIQLRAYQRQALSWMIHREEEANAKGNQEFQKQLELLSELASSEQGRGESGSGSEVEMDIKDGVQCEVGPVLVSDDIASKSKSLDGAQDPVVHPLWQRRFLWEKKDKNGTCDSGDEDDTPVGTVYSFYVNELLKTASMSAPNPPRECCGGILADSMGLGKTVMLLSLIAKDKEQRYQMSKAEEDPGVQEIIDLGDAGDTKGDDAENDNTVEGEKPCTTLATNGIIAGPKTTLVVAPLSLLAQWEEEIQSKSSLSCLAYYGDRVKKISKSTMASVDVLITTYGTLQSEYFSIPDANSNSSLNITVSLFSTVFRRVILDEAHFIKNPKTNVSKACCNIIAERRWCVTGTPFSNSLQDIFGLLKFLKHEPWCVDAFWKKAIKPGKPTENEADAQSGKTEEDKMATSLARVRRVLKPLLLRRTKDTLAEDGKPILTLPPVESKVIAVILSEEERYFYNVLLSKSQNVFDGFIKAGTASKSWFAIFALLQRLRQSCDHLALTAKSRMDEDLMDHKQNNGIKQNSPSGSEHKSGNNKFLKDLLDSFNQKSDDSSPSQSYSQKVVESLTQCIQTNGTLDEECAICLEVPSTDNLAVTPCSHVFCKHCLLDSLNRKKSVSDNGECPICSLEVAASDVIFTQSDEREDNSANENRLTSVEAGNPFDARKILESALKGKPSSKILSIIQELDGIWKEDPGSKVLIFSQYLGMFDFLKKELDKQGTASLRLDGKMALKERQRVLKKFNSKQCMEPPERDEKKLGKGLVLLASMKACGVGLNLTAASSVFIVDPWWNHALESQCINRIHRIGQTAPLVKVRKFIVADSVEEKIVKMQQRKKGMASEVLSDKMSGARPSNPTLDDLKSIFGR